jgi:hypothetical protein
VAITKKGSKMTKKRGSKKGQKRPKMGVQKSVKNDPKIEFFSDSQKLKTRGNDVTIHT